MRSIRTRLAVRQLMLAMTFVVLGHISVQGYQPTPDVPYFPDGVFDGDHKESNAFWVGQYTKTLRAMGEPSLWKLAQEDHTVSVYRLLWVPSFHHRVSVRIVKSGGSFALHAVELDAKGGLDPGKIAIKKTVKLTEEQWTWLLVHIARARFWKMSTCLKRGLNDATREDGDYLLCEGVEDGKYHIVHRHDSELAYETICWYMLSLSGLDVKPAWLEYHEADAFKEAGK